MAFPARAGLLFLFIAASACAPCEPRPNLALYRDRLVKWHDSGAYAACFSKAAAPARSWLKRIATAKAPGGRPAVVLDIDETCLSNWRFLVHEQFATRSGPFERWADLHSDEVLRPTLQLFHEAKGAGIPVFFITGRPENLRTATVRQLHRAGFSGWSELYMRPRQYTLRSIIPFKSGVRRTLEARGYQIVLNMGDQWSDLEGGYALRTFKLPNPFYYIP